MDYKVVSGDTFWSIGQKFHVSVAALEVANPGIAPGSLQVGQVLKIPGQTGGGVVKYTIKSGDTFWSIAQSHGFSVQDLESVNPGINPSNLQVGQVINLPGGHNGSTPPTGSTAYVPYSGPASSFPDPNQWASWDQLWPVNQRLMKFHDSDSEIAAIKQSINQVSQESGIDARVILCIIVQESGGNVRAPTTNNGVRNPGLMQSHNGVEFNPNDPAGSILQMIRDGTEGTRDGPGLQQLYKQYGNYYSAFRAYNSGSVNANDLNDPVGATATYVQAAANRLMGHIWNGM